MLKITNWKVMLDWKDITSQPVWNYIWMSHNGSVLVRPSQVEDRVNGTCIIPEVDDDRVYYRAVYQGDYIELCKDRKEAEKVLLDYEQREYDLATAKDYWALYDEQY